MLGFGEIWLKGAVIGFCIAAPVGPVGVLCIRRSIVWGAGHGFASGLGAATADAFCGVLAAGGFGVLTAALVEHQGVFGLVGSLLMLCLAWGMLRRHAVAASPATLGDKPTLSRAFLSTFAITLANPITILAFAGLMAGLNLAPLHWRGGVLFVTGVFIGSALWWLILSQSARVLRQKMEGRGLRWLDLICGSVLAAFALAALVRAVTGFWVG